MSKTKQYIPILILLICLMAFLVWALSDVEEAQLTPEGLEFRDEANDLTLIPYYDSVEDKYFLFLPACTSVSDLRIVPPSIWSELFARDVPQMEMSNSGRDMEVLIAGKRYTIAIWQCDSLPTVMLQGKPNMLTKVQEKKSNRAAAQVRVLSENGETLFDKVGTLSGRGNGTWGTVETRQAKCPYNLHFSSSVSLGELENLSDWCLFAEYSDESKLRNSLAFFAGEKLNIDFASAYIYVNLYANGEYLGLYGITSKKEYTKYYTEYKAVFESAGIVEPPTFYSDFMGQYIQLMDGEIPYTQERIREFEAGLFHKDWERCSAAADMESIALLYALEEFLCNIDLSYASQYFYIDNADKIHAMLPWDFDYSLGSAITHFNPSQERCIMAKRNLFGTSWYPELIQMEQFRQCVAETIESLFTDDFFDALSEHLRQNIKQIEGSRACDARRWKSEVPFNYSPVASGMEDLSEFYQFFTDFFPKRRAFLLDYFRNYDDYCCITIKTAEQEWSGNVCIPKGSRPAEYLNEEAFLSRISPDRYSEARLMTPEGVPIEDVEAISEDITFVITWI